MKIQDSEQIKMRITNKSYKPVNFTENKKFSITFKIVFSFLIFIFIFFILDSRMKNLNKSLKTIFPEKLMNNKKNEKVFLSKLREIFDKDEILENEIMNKHTTFKLGGPAKFFIKPKSINKIIKALKLCKYYAIDYFILGNGSNLLVSDKGFDGLIININEDNFSNLKVEKLDDINYKVIVGGGMLMRTLAKNLCLLSLSGLEDIIDIPGTIGGGIIMNASAGLIKQIIYNSLDKVKVITPEGEMKELSKNECKLRDRGSMLKDNKYLIYEATFNLIKEDKMIIQKIMADHTSQRYSRQPMYFPSAGSFFVWLKPKFGSLYE